jgi:hypothetical protein
MGIFSGWFSGSSSSAGKIETQKLAGSSAGPAAASGAGKPNVWRSVFDPGSNPNIDRVGSAYYDTVHKDGDKAGAGSTWEQILKAQDFKRRSFSDIDRDKDGFVDAKELAAILPPSAKAVDPAALIQEAKPATQGKLSRKEFNDVLDKYFLA